MFDFFVTCRRCGKEDLHGWHPYWDFKKHRKLCVPCREKMYDKHKVWMDKLHEKYEKNQVPVAISSKLLKDEQWLKEHPEYR